MPFNNPLIAAEREARKLHETWGGSDDSKFDAELDRIWSAASLTADENSRRLARITLKAARFHEASYDAESGRYRCDHTECAAQYTNDPFEARIIGLALSGWWNDAIDAAWSALGLKPERDEHGNFKPEWWESTIAAMNVPEPE